MACSPFAWMPSRPATTPRRQTTAVRAACSPGIRAIPSVRAATYSNNGLFGGSDNGDQITVEGYTPKGNGDGGSRYDAVGPQYFSTLGIPVRLGREITEQDRPDGRAVCVINETFAKALLRRPQPDRHARDAGVRRAAAHLRNRRRRAGLASEPAARRDRASLLHARNAAGREHRLGHVRDPAARRRLRASSPTCGASSGRPSRTCRSCARGPSPRP